MITRWLLKFFPSTEFNVTELELLRQMDKLRELELDIRRMISNTRGKAEQTYWYKKWEETILLHMDFEWLFHPDNPAQYAVK